jgi:esterase/lipase
MNKLSALIFLTACSFAANSIYAADMPVSTVKINNETATTVPKDEYQPKNMQDKIIQMRNDMMEIKAQITNIASPVEMKKVMRKQIIMVEQCLIMMQVMQDHIMSHEMATSNYDNQHKN